MEARGVEGNRVSFIIEDLNILKLGRVRLIIPDSNCFIGGSSGYQFLFETDVHARNRSPMERADQILVVTIILGSLQILVQLEDLIVGGRENNAVVLAVDGHAHDP